MKIEIRKATSKDAITIALLGRVTFDQTFGHLFHIKQDLLNYLNKTFAVEKIRKGLSKENNRFWIAIVDELPVGYAKLKLESPSEFIDSDKVCQLQKIYVLQNFLNLKIGHLLQKEVIEEASALNFDNIWLSVLDRNERAIKFYQKNDFHKIGEHDFMIGSQWFHFLVMTQALI